MNFVDTYILLEQFDSDTINDFRNSYLLGFEEAADYYEYPQFNTNTDFETENIDEMIDYVMENKIEYLFYWNNPNNEDIINGMIFFNNDSSLILGLSVDPEKEKYYIEKLKKEFNTEYAKSCFEVLPPLNKDEFIKSCN